MIQLIFLVAFCLLSPCQSAAPNPYGWPYWTDWVISITPLVVPVQATRNISILGNFLPATLGSGKSYGCRFGGNLNTFVNATYVDSSLLICKTPVASSPQNVQIDIGVVQWSSFPYFTKIFSTAATLNFLQTDKCYQSTSSMCKVFGDPHFTPFCDKVLLFNPKDDWRMQPGNVTINLVTSKDNRFVVHGKTAQTVFSNHFNQQVSYLNALSITGPGSDGKSSSITLDSKITGTVTVYLNGSKQPSTQTYPVDFNGITISRGSQYSSDILYQKFTVKFPGGETVDWHPTSDCTANIWLPGPQYWKNVVGLCGGLDETQQYCLGNDGKTYNYTQREDCAKTWIVKDEGKKRYIAQDLDIQTNDTQDNNETFVFPNITLTETPLPIILSNDTGNSTAFVVTDNILSKAANKICVYLFEILGELCPANYSENLSHYETSCIYDGSALLTHRLEKLSPTTDIDSLSDLISNIKSFFSNLHILGETILDDDSFSFIVSSVNAGLQDCFYRNLTSNSTETEFDIDAFYSSLPGCSSYCVFPGSACSDSDECKLTLTLEELITLADSGSSIIEINVFIFFGSLVLFFLSI